MNSLEKLFDILDKDPYLKRLHELEEVLDKNKDIKDLIASKQEVSKQLMNAKVLGLTNTVADYKKAYDEINQKLIDYPFVEEYLELLDYYNDLLKDMISYLEHRINRGLKES